MRNIILNQTQNHHLIEKGYVQHQLLSELEIQYLLGEVRKLYPESLFLPKDGKSTHPGITTSYLDSDIALRKQISKIVRETLSPHIDTLLEDYRILACGLFVKAPKGGWLDLHYHPTVVEDLQHWVIDIWCPLQATDFANGTFCAVPGSHKIFPRIIECSPQDPPFYQGYGEEIRHQYSVAIPAKPGEAVLFEDSLLHWSPQNLTDSPRYALHCTCIPREATAVYIYLNPGDSKFEIYEVTDQFFIERTRSPQRDNLKLLAILPDHNLSYSFKEFKERMENSSTIRKSMFL
ncbi:MAG: phytanoyl-CoA dioxygenase family protein [Nodosilinea sp. LVE1205-7]|jgi:hypothetical protein